MQDPRKSIFLCKFHAVFFMQCLSSLMCCFHLKLYYILCWSKELRKSGEIKATKWMKTGKFPGRSNADIKARNLLQSVGNFAAIVQPSFNRPMMSWLMLPGVATVIPSFIIVSLDRFWCCSTHYIYTLQIHGVGVGPLC